MSRATFDAPTTRPSGVADRGDGQRDVEPAAVLARPHRLEVLDPLAAAEPVQDVALLVQPLGRDDQGDRPADGLGGGVAEEPLGPGVPRPDDAVERLADDRVVGRLDDGGQPRLGLLGPLPLGHVAEDQDRADRARGPVPDRGGAVVDRPLGSRPGRSGRCGSPARRRPLPQGRGAGFSTGSRVCSLTMWKTSGSGRPAASACGQPVRASATPFRNVTRPSASVAITASPMLARVTR